MANPPRSNSDSDDTRDIVRTKELQPYDERIKELELRVGSNETFAATLKTSAETQLAIRDTVVKLVKEVIANDPEVKQSLHTMIDNDDREAYKVFWRRFGGATKGVLFFIGGTIFAAVAYGFFQAFFTPKH